jgi:hypothetical protein
MMVSELERLAWFWGVTLEEAERRRAAAAASKPRPPGFGIEEMQLKKELARRRIKMRKWADDE